MKFNVDTYVCFGNRTALEVLRAHRGIRSLRPGETTPASALNFCQPGWATFLKKQIFGPGEPQIENGLRPFIEGFNGHRTSHKSISDSLRQYDFAADRTPARCALLRFKVRSSRHRPGLYVDVWSKADKRISPAAPRPSAAWSSSA
jgi:hypothetical protein